MECSISLPVPKQLLPDLSDFIGSALLETGKFQDAVDIYTKALDQNPTHVLTISELLCKRAFANSKIGNFQGAVDDCCEVITTEPKRIDARLLRAEC